MIGLASERSSAVQMTNREVGGHGGRCGHCYSARSAHKYTCCTHKKKTSKYVLIDRYRQDSWYHTYIFFLWDKYFANCPNFAELIFVARVILGGSNGSSTLAMLNARTISRSLILNPQNLLIPKKKLYGTWTLYGTWLYYHLHMLH